MKKIILFTVLTLRFFTGEGQEKKSYTIDFADPKSVVNALFYAAQTKDFNILGCLCDPFGQGDGDTKKLCSLSQIALNEGPKNKELEDFVRSFETGKITGEVINKKTDEGTEYAEVPFWFNSGTGESRNNEKMNLVKRYGNWYLSSF